MQNKNYACHTEPISEDLANRSGPRHLILLRQLRRQLLLVHTTGAKRVWKGSLWDLATNHRFIRGLDPMDAFALGVWYGESRERQT